MNLSTSNNDPSQIEYPREFFNWVTILSIALFTANNWWLKQAFHNWFTGKLSDFLFCFFFPLYCSALLAIFTQWRISTRIGLGALATALPFLGMKTSPAFSSLINETLSRFSLFIFGQQSINIVDNSDLIALPMILLSIVFALKRNGYYA